ncbi:MAG TPA: GAF domain-containing protein, partial [Minicystis sp.]|nr:GAF domain-containing protein [Minicystis sp.]
RWTGADGRASALVAHADPKRRAALADVIDRLEAAGAEPFGASRPVAPGRLCVAEADVDEAALSRALGVEHAPELARALGVRSYLSVPLRARRRVVGALTFLADARGAFGAEDEAFAEDLARRVGIAVENAMLLEDEQRSRLRLVRLQEVTSALSRAGTPAEVAAEAARVGAQALDARASALWIAEPDGSLRLAASFALGPQEMAEWARITADADVPAAHVLRDAAPLFVTGEADYRKVDAEIAERSRARGRSMSFAAMPLVLGARRLGVVVFAFGDAHAFDDDEKAFMTTLAAQSAQALERSRLLDAERAASARLAVLAHAGELLAPSLDVGETLASVTRAAVPSFADWACVDLLAGELLSRVAIAHAHAAMVALGHDLARRFPGRADAGYGAAQVIRSGEPLLVPRIPPEAIDAAVGDPAYAAALRALGVISAVIVPLEADGRVIGAASFCTTTETGRVYGPRDLELARELARRAGVALTNAALFSRERAAAHRIAALEELTSALARAATMHDVAHAAIDRGARAVGATGGVVYLVDERAGVLRLLGDPARVPHLDG